MTRTDLSRHFGNNREAQHIGRALSLLAERGLAVMAKGAAEGGRPPERWFAVTPPTKETKEPKKASEAPVQPEPANPEREEVEL
jgi:hypothetical protein